VLGLTSIISPIVIHDTGAFRDMAAAVVVTALLIPFVLKGRVTRLEGGLMAAAYLGYMFGPLVL
jgi:Ca2+/Na+ antiporter